MKAVSIREEVGDFALAGGMAFLAGATDVYGLARLHDLFVSFMSGNTTLLGKALGEGDMNRAMTVAGIVGLFIGGVVVGTIVAEWSGTWRTPAVITAVAGLLLVSSVRPSGAIPALVLAMGALNAAMSHVGQAKVSLTYVTGTLVKFGQGLGKQLCGKGGGWSWTLQGAMWLCLLAGAVTAVQLQARFGADETWPLPAIAVALALTALVTR